MFEIDEMKETSGFNTFSCQSLQTSSNCFLIDEWMLPSDLQLWSMKQEVKTSFRTITFALLVSHVNFWKSGMSDFLKEENVITLTLTLKTHNQMSGAFRIERAVGWGSNGSHSRIFSVYTWTRFLGLVFYTCKKNEIR